MKAIVAAGLPPPPYFNTLTLMSILVFIQEKVDVGIFEVGIGGDLDCTNVFKNPAVTAVLLLLLFLHSFPSFW